MDRILAEHAPLLSPGRPAAFSRHLADWVVRKRSIEDRMAGTFSIESGQRVLDLGCGGARLAMLLKKARPGADVIGIDEDRDRIASAREAVRRSGLNIPLFDASPVDLPSRDRYFDRVFAGLLFLRLEQDDAVRTAREVFRVLKPGGELYVAACGPPGDALIRLVFRNTRTARGANGGAQGPVPLMLREAGFEVSEATAHMTLFGTLTLYRAGRPGEEERGSVDRHEEPCRS
jgi:ubiquinone/menaquinone biosynthesis C-methylase UbiE